MKNEKILIVNATIVSRESKWHMKKADVLIENGIVSKISTKISAEGTKIITGKNIHISAGFFDPTVHFCDPGEEHKEDLHSGLRAAKSGGFTAVGVLGTTHPAVSDKTRVEYLLSKSGEFGVEVIPIGCISNKNEGEDLAELYDMHIAGAKGFYDGKKQVDSNLLSRALAYTKDMQVRIISYPDENNLSRGGIIHEGTVNVLTGMKGIPSMSEELGIIRDSFVANYHNAHLHFANVSTKEGIDQIVFQKKKNTNITAQCSIHHLYFCDEDLLNFDSNLKILPPLRSKKDQFALLDGLKNGAINNVTSDHWPQDIEAKKMEFDLAEYGAVGIETCFAALHTIGGRILGIEKIVELLCENPRKIFGLSTPKIEENHKAEITVFDTEEKWTYNQNNKKSKAYNNPYLGKSFVGKILEWN